MVDQKALYKVLFEQVGEGLIVTDKIGTIEVVNPRLVEMFGYEEEQELLHQNINLLIPQRFHSKHKKYKADYMEHPADRPMGLGKVLFAVDKSGREFPVEISLSTFEDNDGIKKAIAIVSDVTKRKEMEDELKQLNEELEKLVEIRSSELAKSNILYKSIARNFPNGSIYVFDQDFNYLFADGQALKKRGLSGDDLVGKNYLDLIDQSITDQVIPNLEKVFKGNEQLFEINYRNAIFAVHGVPLKDLQSNNHVDRILVVERDVTKEKKVEEEIKASLERERELNNLKTRFVSIVSHEFRTPLAAIKSSSELIEKYKTTETDDKRMKHTQRIQNSVNHLNGMIEDILSLSKIEEGKVEIKLSDVDLDELIESIVAENKNVFPDQNVSVHSSKLKIKSDRKLLGHILSNLISNAFKYTPDEKLIEIEIKENDKHFDIIVRDEGIGIPESEQTKLFERFYRATNAANIKGTGLGLNIILKYLDYLSGNIRFTSTENSGSEFIVTFPK